MVVAAVVLDDGAAFVVVAVVAVLDEIAVVAVAAVLDEIAVVVVVDVVAAVLDDGDYLYQV